MTFATCSEAVSGRKEESPSRQSRIPRAQSQRKHWKGQYTLRSVSDARRIEDPSRAPIFEGIGGRSLEECRPESTLPLKRALDR